MDTVQIFGVPLDPLTKTAFLAEAERRLAHGPAASVATINTEFLMAARKDPDVAALFARSDLRLADGVGVLWAARFRSLPLPRSKVLRPVIATVQFVGLLAAIILRPSAIRRPLPERLAGSDLLLDLCDLAARMGAPVGFLGGGPGISLRTAEVMKARFPSLLVALAEPGGRGTPEEDAELLPRVAAAAPALLFVAYGAPKQEAWIDRNLAKLPVRLAMGVGGSVDFLVGARDHRYRFGLAARQAPGWMRRIGLDWFWRLVTQPYRWKRVWTAVGGFSLAVLADRISSRD